MQEQNEKILNSKDSVNKVEFETLLKQFNDLQINYETLKKLFEHEKERNCTLINKCTQLENKSEKHNERGAGRKSTLTEEQLNKVRELYEQGLSYGAIAKEVALSKAYVYKLINKQDHKSDDRKYTKKDVEGINRLRQGLREIGHTHSLTKDLEYEE